MGNAGLNLESLCDGENSMNLMHGIDVKMMNHHGCLAFKLLNYASVIEQGYCFVIIIEIELYNNFVHNLAGEGQIMLGVGLQIVIHNQIKYVFC